MDTYIYIWILMGIDTPTHIKSIYICVCVGGIHVGVMAFVWDFNVNHSATTKNAEFTHKWMALRTLSL
jgi:hypothetical protein